MAEAADVGRNAPSPPLPAQDAACGGGGARKSSGEWGTLERAEWEGVEAVALGGSGRGGGGGGGGVGRVGVGVGPPPAAAGDLRHGEAGPAAAASICTVVVVFLWRGEGGEESGWARRGEASGAAFEPLFSPPPSSFLGRFTVEVGGEPPKTNGEGEERCLAYEDEAKDTGDEDEGKENDAGGEDAMERRGGDKGDGTAVSPSAFACDRPTYGEDAREVVVVVVVVVTVVMVDVWKGAATPTAFPPASGRVWMGGGWSSVAGYDEGGGGGGV